eukprot:UN10206
MLYYCVMQMVDLAVGVSWMEKYSKIQRFQLSKMVRRKFS